MQYLRAFKQLAKLNKKITLSEHFSKITNISSFQIRKYLASFAKFGPPGMGYNGSSLSTGILDIIGDKRVSKLAIFGVGNLGPALLNYKSL